jgi:DNA-binding CsgD family transcriptional regulator
MVSRLALLSADERQVMSLRARGLDMLQVRSLLGISDARLVKLLDGAYHKLGIASLEEFVEWELEAATSPVLTAGRGDQAGVQMRLVA